MSSLYQILIRLGLLTVLGFLFSGCAAYGISTVKTEYHILEYEQVSSPLLTEHLEFPSESFLVLRCCNIRPEENTRGELTSTYPPKEHYRKSDFFTAWGEPDKRSDKGGLEYWIYNRELSWYGIAGWIVYPLPIVAPVFIPTGYRKTTVIFEEDVAKYVIKETSRQPFLGCHMMLGQKFKCGISRLWDYGRYYKFRVGYPDVPNVTE